MSKLETWRAPENNKRAICEKLQDAFAPCKHILEIGSGTGQHAVWFGRHMPHLQWQTSDRAQNLEFIRQRLQVQGPDNVIPPIELDVTWKSWPDLSVDGVFAANCIHIMGWPEVAAMFAGIAAIIGPKARLALYGPFKYNGDFTTKSNADFDLWLKSRDPQSGIRDFEAVDELANNIGLTCLKDHAMPANNQLIVWAR